MSLVSPGSGLTVACFNFPFSTKQEIAKKLLEINFKIL